MKRHGYLCMGCEGSGVQQHPDGSSKLCGCEGAGAYIATAVGPTLSGRLLAEMELCEVCGCRAYGKRCSREDSIFHAKQREATELAEQGYSFILADPWRKLGGPIQESVKTRSKELRQNLRFVQQAMRYTTGKNALTEARWAAPLAEWVKVHLDELEDRRLELPSDLLVEMRALQRVAREHVGLWKARILESPRIEPEKRDDPSHPDEALVQGYSTFDQVEYMVYRRPRSLHLHELRWLGWAWENDVAVPYPKEQYEALAEKIVVACHNHHLLAQLDQFRQTVFENTVRHVHTTGFAPDIPDEYRPDDEDRDHRDTARNPRR